MSRFIRRQSGPHNTSEKFSTTCIRTSSSFTIMIRDLTLNDFGVQVRCTPVQAPTANAFSERLIGTLRRECLDYLIPLTERHLNLTLKEFVVYYNRRRPHSALGPGTPEPILATPTSGRRHQLPRSYLIRSRSVLGGLHHDYWLEREAA
jgi:putative transposase